MDAVSAALIENLFTRPQGVAQTFNEVGATYQAEMAVLQQLLALTAKAQVQGAPVTGDTYLTEIDYLRAIYLKLIALGSGGTAGQSTQTSPFYSSIVPGQVVSENGSPLSMYGAYSPTLFNYYNSTSIPDTSFNPPPVSVATGSVAPYFSMPRPYFRLPGLDGQGNATVSFGSPTAPIGVPYQGQTIVQQNWLFQMPRVHPTFKHASMTQQGGVWVPYGNNFADIPGFGVGLGTTVSALNPNVNNVLGQNAPNDPYGPSPRSALNGIWITPLTASTGDWSQGNQWPIVISVVNQGVIYQHYVGNIGVPGTDASPGGIAISWNRWRISVSLWRSLFGMTLTNPPYDWVYPFTPQAWPYNYPYILQKEIWSIGIASGYQQAGITVPSTFTNGSIPPPTAVGPGFNYPMTLISEVDTEQVPYYQTVPIDAVSGSAPSIPTPTVPPANTTDIAPGQIVWVLFGIPTAAGLSPDAVSLGTGVSSDALSRAIIGRAGERYFTWRGGGSTNPFTSADYQTYGLLGAGATTQPVNTTGGLVVEGPFIPGL